MRRQPTARPELGVARLLAAHLRRIRTARRVDRNQNTGRDARRHDHAGGNDPRSSGSGARPAARTPHVCGPHLCRAAERRSRLNRGRPGFRIVSCADAHARTHGHQDSGALRGRGASGRAPHGSRRDSWIHGARAVSGIARPPRHGWPPFARSTRRQASDSCAISSR